LPVQKQKLHTGLYKPGFNIWKTNNYNNSNNSFLKSVLKIKKKDEKKENIKIVEGCNSALLPFHAYLYLL
jgi:hypothetical protein